MKKILLMLAVVFSTAASCVYTGCTHEKEGNIEVEASDPEILYMGRIHWSDSAAVFNYPGMTAMLNFEGSGLSMHAKAGSGYFMVEIDSNAPQKINFSDSVSTIILTDSLAKGEHSARVVYAIEGHEKKPEI